MFAENIFESFVGRWKLQRQIWDGMSSANLIASATGDATFEREVGDAAAPEKSLLFSEHVSVSWKSPHSYVSNATKQYRYVLREGVITKFNITNGCHERMFDLAFKQSAANGSGGIVASGEFLCGCDNYAAKYLIDSNFERFTLNYRIKGKNKDYRTFTVFVRQR